MQTFELHGKEPIVGEARVLYEPIDGAISGFCCSRDGLTLAVSVNDYPKTVSRRHTELGHLFFVNMADGTKQEMPVTHAGWITVEDLR